MLSKEDRVKLKGLFAEVKRLKKGLKDASYKARIYENIKKKPSRKFELRIESISKKLSSAYDHIGEAFGYEYDPNFRQYHSNYEIDQLEFEEEYAGKKKKTTYKEASSTEESESMGCTFIGILIVIVIVVICDQF